MMTQPVGTYQTLRAVLRLSPACLMLLLCVDALAFDPDLNMRIETEIFRIERKQDEILVSSLTLFHQGVAYDYLSEHQEATLIDPVRDRIILLDGSRKLRSELSLKDLASFTKDLQVWAAGQTRNPLLQFASNPKFEVAFHEESGELTLSHRLIRYNVETIAEESPNEAVACKEFWDLSAQLKSVLQPGGVPPFVRMQLNRELELRGRLPRRIELTISDANPLLRSETTLYSQQKFASKLTETDRRLILNFQSWSADFEPVDFATYRTSIRPASTSKSEGKGKPEGKG